MKIREFSSEESFPRCFRLENPYRGLAGSLEVKVFLCFLFLYFLKVFLLPGFGGCWEKIMSQHFAGNDDNDDVFLKCADAVGMFLISIAQYKSYK